MRRRFLTTGYKEDTMKKIEAVIRPTKAGDVYAALGGRTAPVS